uniref:TNFR-Cys domain-containing protein n=1 Tax=Mola mola TaxID=94237 RepID=A0A3Q3VWI7_MOLML
MTRHSKRCLDLTTYWDPNTSSCVPCKIKKGRKVTPNCGYDDDGGRHEIGTVQCEPVTFNDGSTAHCRPCKVCPAGSHIVSPCNRTDDTRCLVARLTLDPALHQVTLLCYVRHTKSCNKNWFPQSKFNRHLLSFCLAGVVPVAIIISVVLAVLCVIYVKRKRGLHIQSNLQVKISTAILSAPLQTVLDHLDTLEELVILLDPDVQGVKSTKHLASLCSFPSTWITYTYSMKESKSPLKAVLEGISSRQPDWTVRHLANMLRLMERNDAITVLAKLQLSKLEV